MKTLEFRRARSEDAPRLTEIAFVGKGYWGYPAEWMELWRHDLIVTTQYIRTEAVQVAEFAGEVVGFVGLSAGDEGRHIEHLWLKPEYIGRGFGRKLFEEAAHVAWTEGVIKLFIRSDPNAEGFYLKMGATRIGEEIYELPGAVHRAVPLFVYQVHSGS
jgi:GNAT superfamily N-acetyltransferase